MLSLYQNRWKDPPAPYPPVGGLTYAHASCYVSEKFSGRVQMYDGCCSVRWRLKRSLENWGPIVVVRGASYFRLAPVLLCILHFTKCGSQRTGTYKKAEYKYFGRGGVFRGCRRKGNGGRGYMQTAVLFTPARCPVQTAGQWSLRVTLEWARW